MRKAQVSRKTQETQITVKIDLDGSGRSKIATGVPFLDHMLEQIARHGVIDLEVVAKGDLLEIVNFPHFFLSMLYKQAGMEGDPVFPRVDNRALDGFLERMREVDCTTDGCTQCHLCDEYAKRAVETPEGVTLHHAPGCR